MGQSVLLTDAVVYRNIDTNGEKESLFPDNMKGAYCMEKETNLVADIPLTPDRPHYCMTARYHSGDENGKSCAKFAALVLSKEAREAGYEDVWLVFEDYVVMKESSSVLDCSAKPAVVIASREHTGDENAKTYYQLARVMAQKRAGMDEKPTTHCCVADNFIEVTNEKESKANWVESEGRVIVGRTHTGDENGKTVTRFAKIYILDEREGKRYPLELANVKEMKECKESDSDFRVDSPPIGNTFSAWAAPAFDQEWINHAWVKSALPDDRFRCMGGTDAKYFIADFAVDQKAYKVMDACRGTKDCAGILLYGIQGVCHQMANRFIFPVTGRHMKRNNKHPKGYIISTSVYGLKGTWYTTWYATKVLPAMKKFKAESMSQEDMDVVAYDIEKELEGLQKDIASLFEEVGINVPAGSIRDAQKEWLLRREEIMKKYNILAVDGSMVEPVSLTAETVRAMMEEVIKAQRVFLATVRDKIGLDNFRIFNDDEDEIQDIIDVETALHFYFD